MKFFEVLHANAIAVEKEKGQHVFRQGDDNKSLYFIQSGLLKAYYTTSEGKEAVKSFLSDNDFIGSLSAAYSQQSCTFSLICLERTKLLQISFNTILDYCQKDHQFSVEIIEFLLAFAMKKERREYEFLCLDAQSRYRQIISDTPHLLERVTQNDLARYLGVTPVGLSRIKKRSMSG